MLIFEQIIKTEIYNILYENSNNIINMQYCTDNLKYFLKQSNKDPIYWSYKYDGVRCWIYINKRTIPHKGSFKKIADIKYISRNDVLFENLHFLDNEIIEFCHYLNRIKKIKYPIILDCEVVSPNKNLQEIMTQLVRKSNVNYSIFSLFIFDIAISDYPFSKRYELLKEYFNSHILKNIHLIKHNIVSNISELGELKNKAVHLGYEGIMLFNGNSKYDFGKTTNACCKYKDYKTIDLKIIGFEVGRPKTKWEDKLSVFICDYNGTPLRVTGKISLKDRLEYIKNPPLGKYAEIKFSEKTTNGKLRHPVFIRLRPDKDII